MTWTKIPDEWTDRREFSMLSADDRWHYLAMVVFCSRGDYSDGILSLVQARRASDHPDPDAAIGRLEELGLVELSPAAPILRLVEIELHFPPPSKRSDRTGAERQRRKRAHDRGDHTLCLPKHCPSAIGHAVTERDGVTGGATGAERAVGRDMSRVTVKGPETAENRDSSVAEPESVTALVTRDPGTGRDGTATTTQPSLELGGRDVENEADPTTGEVADWPTRVPGEPDAWQESEPGRWEPVTKGAA